MLLRMALALCFVVPTSCATSRAVAPDGERARAEPKMVRVEALSGDRLQLSFAPVAPDPSLEVLRLEEARDDARTAARVPAPEAEAPAPARPGFHGAG